MGKTAMIVLGVLALGCGGPPVKPTAAPTPYRDSYRDQRLDDGRYALEIRCNHATTTDKAREYLALRASELCGAKGFVGGYTLEDVHDGSAAKTQFTALDDSNITDDAPGPVVSATVRCRNDDD